MTTPEDEPLVGKDRQTWQDRPAPGPRGGQSDREDEKERLASHLWGEPEDEDA
ncbi:MAG: hypothetical protein AAGJ28_16830 [Pseudomonadota bacterium]